MKVQVSHRLDEELLAWATEYGESRGTSRAVIIEQALRHFRRLSKGGVPDLPVVDSPQVKEQRAKAAVPAGMHPDGSRDTVPMARQRRLNEQALRARAGR